MRRNIDGFRAALASCGEKCSHDLPGDPIPPTHTPHGDFRTLSDSRPIRRESWWSYKLCLSTGISQFHEMRKGEAVGTTKVSSDRESAFWQGYKQTVSWVGPSG